MSNDNRFKQDCLLHLERAGFSGVPRFLGIDEEKREILSFIVGDVPTELGHYGDMQVCAAATLMRGFHDATANMDAVRARGCEVACHNDWSPNNTVFRRDLPIAMIDFDTAAPGTRLWDLGYSVFVWLDLGNEDYTANEQSRRLAIFAEAYGLESCSATQIAVHAVARQTALAASAAARNQIDIARWASAAAEWTALNLLERLLPTGYPPPTAGLG